MAQGTKSKAAEPPQDADGNTTSEAGKESLPADAFLLQVTTTLEHCTDPAWLGAKSPLAAPYLLGKRLDQRKGSSPDSSERGAILFAVMTEASTLIEDEELRSIIQNRYLKRNQYLSNTGLALRSGVSERTFYRLRNRAIAAFSTALYGLLVPPLRLERPNAPTIAGRIAPAATLSTALLEGSSVYLSGESGIGKSSLAAATMRTFAGTHALFWFTIRPGFNDYYASFVFALAYFLHEQGAPNTWRQIIAESGRIHEERTLALLRHDCAALIRPALLCIDEIDQLRVEITEHSQLFALIDSLQSIAPDKITLFLIGQRVVQVTPIQVRLSGLTLDEVSQWAESIRLPGLKEEEIERVTAATGGSPLLLSLFATLVRANEDINHLLHHFSENPSLESLLVRIWQRLDGDERMLLMRLAVFNLPAPADAFLQQATMVETLVERTLIQREASGEIAVTPHLRPLVYARISTDLRRAYHAEASRLLEERGNIIGAMQQAVTAREENHTLLLWLAHRDDEIARGHANQALMILRSIAASDVAPSLSPILQTARADLEILLGDIESANATLRTLPSLGDNVADGFKTYLLARSYEHLGENARADALLQEALTQLTPPTLFVRTRVQNLRGYLHILKMRDLSHGRRLAANARIEAEVLQGWVEEASGNLLSARDFFARALSLAEQVQANPRTMTYVHTNLGRVLMNLNQVDEGIDYMQRAMAAYEAMGDLSNALSNRINIAYAQTISGDPQSALHTAVTGLESALRLKEPYLIAGLAAAAGEAAVYTGDVEDAERYLDLSLGQEEEFHRPWALTSLGVLRAKQNRQSEAVRLLQAAVAEAQNVDDSHAEAYALHPLALSQQALGDLDGARTSISRAHELYTSLGMANETDLTANLMASLST